MRVTVPDSELQTGSSVLTGPRDVATRFDFGQDLAALGALTAEMGSVPVGDQTDRVLDWTRKELDVEASEIFLREPGGQDMLLSYFRGECESAFSEVTRFHIGQGYPGLVLANGESIGTFDLRGDDRYLRERVKAEVFRTYLCVPLHGSDGIIGVLNLASRRTDLDIERAERLLNSAGAFVSSILEATSFRTQLAVMTPITEMSIGGGIDDLSLKLLEHMMAVGDASAGQLRLFCPDGSGPQLRITSGAYRDELRPEDSLPCPALTGESGMAMSGARDHWPPQCRHVTSNPDVVQCLPLIYQGDPVGLVQLQYESSGPRPATKHVAVLHAIAARMAGVLMRVRDAEPPRPATIRSSNGSLAQNPQPAGKSAIDPVPNLAFGRTISKDPVAPGLDVRCFGPFGLFKDGHRIAPGSVQRRGALTLLKMFVVNEGHTVTRDVMAEALWPDADPDVIANRIYVLIHALRRAIENPEPGNSKKWIFIQNDGDRYYLNPDAPYRSDIGDFRSLVSKGDQLEARGRSSEAVESYQSAFGLYTGDLFEDEPYAEWCWAEREHLRETALNVAIKLAAQHARRGELDASINLYRRALRIDSLREEIHRGLISTLMSANRRAEAVRQYDVCSVVLSRELGVDPLPETRRLVYGPGLTRQ
jgi:DNA-binding SARP family transcriptional activator